MSITIFRGDTVEGKYLMRVNCQWIVGNDLNHVAQLQYQFYGDEGRSTGIRRCYMASDMIRFMTGYPLIENYHEK